MSTEPRQHAATMRQRLARLFYLDPGTPEAIRRPIRWSLFVGPIGPLAAITLILLKRQGVVPGFDSELVVPLIFAGVILVILCRGAIRHTLRRAAAHDHLLCPSCLYDLRTLDDAGTCPECGRPYEHAAVRAQWLDAQHRLKRK